jgi:hypothetical protein
VRVGEVKSLHELQARPARGRLTHSICLQTASISDDNERTRYHGQSLTQQHCSRTIRWGWCFYNKIRLPLQHRACSNS